MTFSARVRLLCLATIAATSTLHGCADDECTTSALSLEIAPAPACLQLSVRAEAQAGTYTIVGTNGCTEPLVVHNAATHDGGPNQTFEAGAQISIPLTDSELVGQSNAMKRWSRNAVLGSEVLVITVTKAPC